MTYRIKGLSRGEFEKYFSMSDAELAEHRAQLVVAESDRGYPCRVSLENARRGERLLLLHHTSHDVETPFRSSFAIYVREVAEDVPDYVDSLPPVFEGRPLALRGYSADGMLKNARLALAGDADGVIRELFADQDIAYIEAHNAAHGCFAAHIERDER